jgi:hypothetical protein
MRVKRVRPLVEPLVGLTDVMNGMLHTHRHTPLAENSSERTWCCRCRRPSL